MVFLPDHFRRGKRCKAYYTHHSRDDWRKRTSGCWDSSYGSSRYRRCWLLPADRSLPSSDSSATDRLLDGWRGNYHRRSHYTSAICHHKRDEDRWNYDSTLEHSTMCRHDCRKCLSWHRTISCTSCISPDPTLQAPCEVWPYNSTGSFHQPKKLGMSPSHQSAITDKALIHWCVYQAPAHC